MTVAAAIAIFALFQYLGGALGSDRGQFGLLIAPIIVLATALVDRLIAPAPWREVFARLGLFRPVRRGVIAAVIIGAILLIVVPIYGHFTRGRIAMYPEWLWLLPGLFAQGGIAEETLFRGFLYRRFRIGRSFSAAVWLSSIPFVAAHLVLFLTMPAIFAAAAVALALIVSFPLAHAFEIGGRTIWAAAILHATMQGGIRVMTLTGDAWAAGLPFAWMIACAIVPWAVFFVSRRGGTGDS